MNKEEAKRLIKDTLNRPFSENRFTELVVNLLNDMELITSGPIQGSYIKQKFRDDIKQYRRIGKFYDPARRRIDVLAVRLKKATSLERARTMQRNFVAWYLNGGRGDILRDAALVAFYHDDLDYWRFSFVKMEYNWVKSEDGKVKAQEDLTPAKRCSFLVGKGEPIHTAAEQLLPLLQNDTSKPSLKQIEDAFSIEKVSEEFFNEYRERFLDLKDELDRLAADYEKVAKEFERKNISTANLAKKILGQIVFLYFIQKKGWLGVEKGKAWGTGPHDFLQKLYKKKIIDYDNFYNDILEPLFYEALATDRGELNYYNYFNCRIPFLNGGLFEPLKGYNWVEVDILINNEIFGNIFETFDKYNFTVREDEPLEKEVAVDPEMLGKVFERLLEVNDRKSKGAYYTPREVVHYMCQESLINYLATEFEGKLEKEKLEKLIKFGDLAIENDTAKIEQELKSYDLMLDSSIKENAELIDQKLAEIKICDPAIGSGAFPVGMMHEIVRTRNTLTSYFDNKFGRTTYNFKRHAIQESIYGVDIDAGAVEIAKLRLWLSLVVEEEDINQIRPLPNLDFRIMQGNSLVEEFMDIKLDYEFDSGSKLARIQTAENERINELVSRLKELLKEFFNASAKQDKAKLREKVDQLIIKIYETELKSRKQNYFKKLNEIKEKAKYIPGEEERKAFINNEKKRLKKIFNFDLDEAEKSLKEYTDNNKEKSFFLWKVFFADVFMDKSGFDIVIANPPYVNTKEVNKKMKKKYKEIFGLSDDLYNYFFLQAFNILRDKGILSFITSDTYFTINSKINLRKLFQSNRIIELIKTENVFENVKVEPAIIIVRKEEAANNNYKFIFKDAIDNFDEPDLYEMDINVSRNVVNQVFFKPTTFNMQVYNKYGKAVRDLYNQWWDKIETSRKIKANEKIINEYRNSLKPGDVTLLGLVVEGGVGLQTGDNGRFVGVIEGSKVAERVKETRPEKLYSAVVEYQIKELSQIDSKEAAKEYLASMTEYEIRELFDRLKSEYDRDIFGQGYLYKIISKEEIANVKELTEEEKLNGIDKNKPHFVLYDKGDKDGNRWYLESPYYIDWSKESVVWLSTSPKARWQGYDFYFREGFCWSDIHTLYIKSRLKLESIHDVKSMSLFSQLRQLPDWYLVCILNSTFISKYVFDFINNTQTFQINDARQVPIIIPTEKQLKEFEKIFDRAFTVKKKQFNGEITEDEAERRLDIIQQELDEMVYDLYGLES